MADLKHAFYLHYIRHASCTHNQTECCYDSTELQQYSVASYFFLSIFFYTIDRGIANAYSGLEAVHNDLICLQSQLAGKFEVDDRIWPREMYLLIVLLP